MPSVRAAPGVAITSALRTHSKVMSTANCAPWLIGSTLVRGSHGHIQIAHFCVASHRGPGLSAHPGQGSFWSSPASVICLSGGMLLGACQTRPTCYRTRTSILSNGSRNLSKTRARKSCGSTMYSSPVGAPWRTALEPGRSGISSGLVCGARLDKHHGLPEMVLERRGPVVLPAVLPLTADWNRWVTPRPQLVPPFTSHEPTTGKHHGCFV